MARLSMEEAGVRVRRLARAGLDAHAFFEGAGETVARAVPIGGAPPFWNTIDPSSQLITSIHFSGDCFFDLGGQIEWEYLADDVNKTADVIANQRGIQTLHEVTRGHPERSPVFRDYLRPNGIDQEVAVALRARTGEAWGTLRLNRAPGQPEFSTHELAFLRSLAPPLAEGVQRALLLGEAVEPEWPDAPGLVILGHGLSVESVSVNAHRWLGELTGDGGGIPAAVLSVAAQASNPDGPALVRLRADTGRWFVLHGTSMTTPAGHRAAVIIQPAAHARISSVLMAAYGLTRREREVMWLVLKGRSTAMIADELVIAPATVQQHLKSIFAKTGVRSRRIWPARCLLTTTALGCATTRNDESLHDQRAAVPKGQRRANKGPRATNRSSMSGRSFQACPPADDGCVIPSSGTTTGGPETLRGAAASRRGNGR